MRVSKSWMMYSLCFLNPHHPERSLQHSVVHSLLTGSSAPVLTFLKGCTGGSLALYCVTMAHHKHTVMR